MNDNVHESINQKPADACVHVVKSPPLNGVHFIRVNTSNSVLWFVQQPSYELERLRVRVLVAALDEHYAKHPNSYQNLSILMREEDLLNYFNKPLRRLRRCRESSSHFASGYA